MKSGTWGPEREMIHLRALENIPSTMKTGGCDEGKLIPC